MSKDLKKVKDLALRIYREDIILDTGNSQDKGLGMGAFLMCLRSIKDVSVVRVRAKERLRGNHHVVLCYTLLLKLSTHLYFSKHPLRKW